MNRLFMDMFEGLLIMGRLIGYMPKVVGFNDDFGRRMRSMM